MRKVKTCVPAVLFVICAASYSIVAQKASGNPVEGPAAVIKFSWDKERLRPIPSMAPLASQDELIQQSRREQQLSAARNTQQKGTASRIETQTTNHQQAKIKAQQTEMPRDGYRYKVTLRNTGEKTIKSIDWDYFFVDPNTNQELSRHQFTSDETIKPGKSKEVTVLYLKPPVKTVDARSLKKSEKSAFAGRVVVARLQFSDGSVWQHP